MAIYIQIKKITEIDDTTFYRVSTKNFKVEKPFFMGINLVHSYINFYKQEDFNQQPTFSISLIDPVIQKNEWITSGLIVRIFTAVRKALKRDGLTEYISYEA